MNFLTLDVFLIIFIGMGPVKVLLLYIAATKDASPELQRKVARKAIRTAVIVGIVLLVAGVVFMRLLHFSRGALTIAGGLILLILALNVVLSPAQKKDQEATPDEATLMSMAVYPLGIPMLLNPIGIVALTVFSAEAQTIVDLAQFFKPTVTLIDATKIMTKNGPSGGSLSDVAVKNTLILSNDPVAADALAARLFDRRPEQIGFIRLAQKRNLGTYDLEQLDQKKVVL